MVLRQLLSLSIPRSCVHRSLEFIGIASERVGRPLMEKYLRIFFSKRFLSFCSFHRPSHQQNSHTLKTLQWRSSTSFGDDAGEHLEILSRLAITVTATVASPTSAAPALILTKLVSRPPSWISFLIDRASAAMVSLAVRSRVVARLMS